MQPDSSEIRENLRQQWSDAAPFWKKWDLKLSTQSQAATDLVVEGASLSPGLHVLDLACGTGQPAISVAQKIAPLGRVIATDMTPEMIEATQHNAYSKGISNLEAQVADAEHLPFSDAAFDRVTCRFGIMFFPELDKALDEIRRVLKPRGRISFLTWGPLDQNPIFSDTMGPFMKVVSVPPPPPDSPTIFRFADASKLKHTLTQAGFRKVSVIEHTIPWPWPGSPQDGWDAVRELAVPFKKVINAVPPEKLPGVVEEVLNNLTRFYDGDQVNFTATVNLATAEN
ncbi:MAG TPA: class I SAM-dependent methyltransferase [Terriglobales bacterium]|nr:class I SAM-dependent methyltransferase [Terriglobales bacterium]